MGLAQISKAGGKALESRWDCLNRGSGKDLLENCRFYTIGVISSNQTLSEVQRAQAVAAEVTNTLVATLISLRQYVVETDPSVVEQFRLWAETLVGMVEASAAESGEHSFDDVRTSIRGGLRDYRDRAERYINELRARLASTTASLNGTLEAIQSSESVAEEQIQEEIAHLGSLRELRNVEKMRGGLGRSVASLTASVSQLRREKDAVISRLSEEIHTLQNSLEKARRAARMEVITELCDREAFEKLITEEAVNGSAMSVVRLVLQNFGILTTWYHRNVMDQLISAFCKRARGVLPQDAVLGRWRENMFCILLRSTDARAIVTSLVPKCRGNYVCMDGAFARTLYLQVSARTYTFPNGSGAAHILERLENSRAS